MHCITFGRTNTRYQSIMAHVHTFTLCKSLTMLYLLCILLKKIYFVVTKDPTKTPFLLMKNIRTNLMYSVDKQSSGGKRKTENKSGQQHGSSHEVLYVDSSFIAVTGPVMRTPVPTGTTGVQRRRQSCSQWRRAQMERDE